MLLIFISQNNLFFIVLFHIIFFKKKFNCSTLLAKKNIGSFFWVGGGESRHVTQPKCPTTRILLYSSVFIKKYTVVGCVRKSGMTNKQKKNWICRNVFNFVCAFSYFLSVKEVRETFYFQKNSTDGSTRAYIRFSTVKPNSEIEIPNFYYSSVICSLSPRTLGR